MVLFAVNTGCRSGEIRRLKWDWEVVVPGVEDSIFIVPDDVAKNGQEHIVKLNSIAIRVVESERARTSLRSEFTI